MQTIKQFAEELLEFLDNVKDVPLTKDIQKMFVRELEFKLTTYITEGIGENEKQVPPELVHQLVEYDAQCLDTGFVRNNLRRTQRKNFGITEQA